MLDILKNRSMYDRIILAAVPLMAVCAEAANALTAALISLFAVIAAGMCISLLKAFLNRKTAVFAQIVIAVGIVGILSALCSVFASGIIGDIGMYLPLISVTTVLLVDCEFALSNRPAVTAACGAIVGGANALFLICGGIIREILGHGSLFGIDIYTAWFSPAEFFATPAGGLFTAAILAICYRLSVKAFGGRKGAHS